MKSFHLFSLTWFVKHIFFCIFNALTSLLWEILTFYKFIDEWMECNNNFHNCRRFSEKNVPLKAWSSWVSTMYVMTFCCHKESFQKPITPCHDYLPFFLPSLSIIHVRVYFLCLIHHNLPHVHLFESETFSSFSVYLFPYE